MITATPTPTPIAIHFQSSLVGSIEDGFSVDGEVGVGDLNRVSTRDMVAPMAVSSSDLCATTI